MFLSISLVHWLVILSAAITITGASTYIRSIFIGKTKPNLVTWFLWALAPLIGVGAALSADADLWATIRIFLAGFVPLIIIVISLFKRQSYWKLGWFDFLCGGLSLIALVTWLFIDLPRLAILLAALADGFAALPTIVKAWRYPETENGLLFIASLISTIIIIPSIPNWNIENSAFQIYLVIANILLVFAVYRRRFLTF